MIGRSGLEKRKGFHLCSPVEVDYKRAGVILSKTISVSLCPICSICVIVFVSCKKKFQREKTVLAILQKACIIWTKWGKKVQPMGKNIEDVIADELLVLTDKIQTFGFGTNTKAIRRRKRKKREAGSLSYKAWRYAVFTRDKFTCQQCGAKLSVDKLEAHHIKPFSVAPELEHVVSNGLTLCHECHVKTDSYGGRGHFKENGD
jgi:hypothetical protein